MPADPVNCTTVLYTGGDIYIYIYIYPLHTLSSLGDTRPYRLSSASEAASLTLEVLLMLIDTEEIISDTGAGLGASGVLLLPLIPVIISVE